MAAWLAAAWVCGTSLRAAGAADLFEAKVRPVLVKNCHACHTASKMGGLELTSRQALLRGGQSGPAVRVNDPDGSLLIQVVRHTHARIKMPPTGKLTDAEIADFSIWIRDGAPWPETKAAAAPASARYHITPEQRAWWSFQPVRKPAPPAVRNEAWARTAVDRFLLAALEQNGLKPVEQASRRVWLRRATYGLTGLPPAPAEMDAFLADRSPKARETVIERLLASPRYGEHWGRYWLDIARYSDDKLNSTQDDPQPNVWRYRDWVIQALNDDMPYDRFVRAQIAGDLMPERERYLAGLGFFANSPQFQDDRVDVLTRGVLALTVACAQCHDHKFDPIPTRDYYSLLGVFENTKPGQHPLVPKDVVEEYGRRKTAHEKAQKLAAEFEHDQATQLAEILASQAALYLRAARTGEGAAALDAETLERWKKYLAARREHPYLEGAAEDRFDNAAFQALLLETIAEKKEIDRENLIRLGGKTDDTTVRVIEVKSLPRDKYFLWRDIVSNERAGGRESGVLYYKGETLDRFLAPFWKQRLAALRAARDERKTEVPAMYPFLMTIEDVAEPKNIRVRIRGSEDNLGEEAPRQFLEVLCQGEPKPFQRGSGRLELAEAVASPDNPLTSRVIANRVWMYHFGRALAPTPGNFGRLGEPPSHPALLDYLASRLVEQNWSLKALHREILLSSAYGLAARSIEPNQTTDAANKFLWRAHRRRLDVEPLRDTLLFLAGTLDETRGGDAVKLTSADNRRRTVYGFVSRRSLDRTLATFDFPNPMATSEQRIHTATPLQQLFFLNSPFVMERARELAKRLEASGGADPERIRAAYRLLFQRPPEPAELKMGLGFLAAHSWPRYAQALLASSELVFVE